ncbi:MAG: hypothetical protein IJ520_04395 [Synergistaceae bacterium]|nr:hypothetical protein [Synergistaceae bacterium]
MKKIVWLLLFIFACSAAEADLVYTYTDSSGNGRVGCIKVDETDSESDSVDYFNFTVNKDTAERSFNNLINASAFKRSNKSYVIVTEAPKVVSGAVSNDTAYIYNYDSDGDWTFDSSFDMIGALNVKEVAISANGNSLFAAARGFEDKTSQAGIIEYAYSSFLPTGNAFIFSKDIDIEEDCVVRAEDLIIYSNTIFALFSVKASDDIWLNSYVTRLDGQLEWRTRYRNYEVGPRAMDFAQNKSNQVVVACMGNDGVSGDVSLLYTNSSKAVSLTSGDIDGNLVGEVLAVGRAYDKGVYFIAASGDVETLYVCSDNKEDTLSYKIMDVTPEANSAVSDRRKIAWDDVNKLVFVMTGDSIIVIDENHGSADDDYIVKIFSSSELGGWPSSISETKKVSSKKSSSSNSGCDALSLSLIALLIPAAFVKFKRF